jgi:hypothetical protein
MARRLLLIEKRILSPNGTNNSEGELHGETSIRGARSELISYAQVRRGTWTHRDRRTKRGQISRVSCTKCGTVSRFKLSSRTLPHLAVKTPSHYDKTLTYRAGQSMTHQMFGVGEVTGLIDPQKIDGQSTRSQ